MESPTRYFWAPPQETFLPGKHADILACVTKDQFPMPDFCCRCGSSRPRFYPLKVKSLADSALAGSIAGLALGHIGTGIEYLVRKKIAVPCCSACLIIRRVGYAVAFFFCLLGVAPLVMLGAADQATKLQNTLTPELIVVISLFLLPAIGVGIACWCSWRSLPVVVYARGDQLYLEFWSPAYQQLILGLVPVEKTTIVSSEPP